MEPDSVVALLEQCFSLNTQAASQGPNKAVDVVIRNFQTGPNFLGNALDLCFQQMSGPDFLERSC